MGSRKGRARYFPIVAILFLLVVAFLTIVSFHSAFRFFFAGGGAESGNLFFYLITGVLGLFILVSMATRFFRRYKAAQMARMRMVVTLEECESCKFKSIREFERDDFIYKRTDKECPKCKSPLIITAIYRRA